MKNNLAIVYLASFIIVAAGLKAANAVVFPFLMAVFIAIVISPVLDKLESLKIPRILAFIIVVVIVFSSLGFVASVVIKTINGLLGHLPELQAKFHIFTQQLIIFANTYGFELESVFQNDLDPNKIFSTITTFLRGSTEIITKGFFIFLLITFMLFERHIFEQKVEYFADKNTNARAIVNTFISNLKHYLAIKSIASLTTGIIIWLGLEILGVAYAPLWGVVAFVLNFIPTIGSIVAAFPALLVALLLNDIATVFWTATLYLVVNVAIGNFIEPKFLGKGLGISTLVVLLSLLFWGFLLGIGGMFLAIPLTMSLKIAFDAKPQTKFISVLLSGDDNNQ